MGGLASIFLGFPPTARGWGVEDKTCRRWLRRGRMALPALSPPFTSRYFPVSCAAGCYTSNLKLLRCLLNPSSRAAPA